MLRTANTSSPRVSCDLLQVDCAKAHKGLFCGILLLVVCIISLILFFVLIKKPNYRHIGVLQAHIVELLVYVINAIACIIAAFQVQSLQCLLLTAVMS